MNDLWSFDPDAADGPDPVVTAALRSLVPPEHDGAFWDELEGRLAAETAVAPTSVVPVVAASPPPPPPPPLAEVVPLAAGSPRPRPSRWLAAAAAVVVVALGVAALVGTTSTDVKTNPATSSVPLEPSTTAAPPPSSSPSTVAPPVTAPPTSATAPASTAKPAATSTSVARTTTTARAPFTLSPDGVGPLRLGMTIPQASATGALGAYEDFSGNGTCGIGYGAGSYRSTDFAALFLDGRLAIFYAEQDSRLRTPQGIGIGSPESKLSAVPGTRSESPHPYGAGTNVDFMSGGVGYRFTVDQGTVRMWSVGTKAGLALTEACS